MNPLQKTVLMMLCKINSKVFTDIPLDDKDFYYRLTEYNSITGRNLRIANDADGNTILLWTSYTGKTIACPVTKAAFMFSMIGVWENGSIKDMNAYFHNSHEKISTIISERDENKTLLKLLDRSNELYFRGLLHKPIVPFTSLGRVFFIGKPGDFPYHITDLFFVLPYDQSIQDHRRDCRYLWHHLAGGEEDHQEA